MLLILLGWELCVCTLCARHPDAIPIQWNPSIAATVGEWHFGCYTEVAVVEGFRVLERPLLGNGILAVIRRWLL